VSNLSTVSDAKRKFNAQHSRPINSIFRRVVEELLVEMHLLSVNAGFVYDPIYALGVVSSFDKFMADYRPEADKASIFAALCQCINSTTDKYRQDAAAIQAAAAQLQGNEDVLGKVVELASGQGGDALAQTLQLIGRNPNFKYSRLFGIGLFDLLNEVAADKFADAASRTDTIGKISTVLNLPADKLGKDLDSYRSSLTKLVQMQAAMADIIEADRKKREQREQEKSAAVAATTTVTETTEQ
jgi:photosystem II biogenesis protein Psp29